jgi:hypothetical protein
MSTTRSRRSPKRRPAEEPPAPAVPRSEPTPAPPPPEAGAPGDLDRLERVLLLHLLEHRGQQVRFEASQWTTEFGLLRRFSQEDPGTLKAAIRALEMTRMIYRRTQYVVGYSEPKQVFSLTPTGHRKALECQREDGTVSEGRAYSAADRTAMPIGGSGDSGDRSGSDSID